MVLKYQIRPAFLKPGGSSALSLAEKIVPLGLALGPGLAGVR
jgi:hypothetical protein